MGQQFKTLGGDQSTKHKFSEWAADDAPLFREEVALCNRTLAAEIAKEIFNKPLRRTIRDAASVQLADSTESHLEREK